MNLFDILSDLCQSDGIHLANQNHLESIMTGDVKKLTMDHTIEDCRKFMANYRIRHVPVFDYIEGVDEEPRYIGVVSHRDVLRVATPFLEQEESFAKVDQQALRQLLSVIVEREYEKTFITTPVYRVIQKMLHAHVDMLSVMEGEELVGIVTTTNFLRIYHRIKKYMDKILGSIEAGIQEDCNDENLHRLKEWILRPVSEIMTRDVVCLPDTNTICQAKRKMQKHTIRHLPVVNEEGVLKGIVSDRDILKCLPFPGKKPPYKSKIFRNYLFQVDPGRPALQLEVRKAMTKRVHTVVPENRVLEAADLIYNHSFGSVPVVDDMGRVEGILSTVDLIANLLELYSPACVGEQMQNG